MELFEPEGLSFVSRWLHIVVGIAWVGLLYYFNFVQVPAFAEMSGGGRTEAVDVLARRALWWFRWASVATLATGLGIIGFLGPDYSFEGPGGLSIQTGMAIAVLMGANVWMVIWKKQQVVLASAAQVRGGGQALPEAADAGRRSLLVSRQNAIFSVPMVWFMTATSHFAPFSYDDPDGAAVGIYWLLVLAIVGGLQLNALGRFGALGAGHRLAWPYESVRNALISAFALWAVFLVIWEILFG